MVTLRHVLASSLFACSLATAALAARMPDVERGRALYENHCIACHGRSVHARPGRSPPTHAELTLIIE